MKAGTTLLIMALFILNSRITIGSATTGPYANAHATFEISGVHEVRIKKSIHSIVETAVVTLPSIAKYVPKNGTVPVTVTTGLQFFDGDPITIELGYDGDLRTEFVGFVKRRDLAMPLVVECEGYSWQLRNQVSVSKDFTKKNTTAEYLLNLACVNTDISVECPVDFPLSGISLVKADGVRICDYIKQVSDNVLTLFFISPTRLYCGLTYSMAALATPNSNPGGDLSSVFKLPMVSYRPGWNTPKDNALKERIPSEPVQVIMKGKLASAVQVYTESKRKSAARKMQSLVNHVPDNATLGKFAQEKEYMMNYTGFEGKLTGFLQPYAAPGYDAYVTDSRYPDLVGTYVIESTEVQFGVKGARRICELGPRVGFDN